MALPASSTTTDRRAHASSGRCAISRTVRPSRSRSTASPDELRALRVEVCGRLVEDRRAARREGTRAQARSGAARRPTAAGLRLRPPCRSRAEGLHELVGAGERRRRREPRPRWPRRAPGGCSPRRCRGRSSGAAEPRRASASRPPCRSSARSTPPTVTRPAVGLGEPEEQARDGALAGAALPDEREGLARKELEVEFVEHEPGARGIRERHAFEADGLGGRRRRRNPCALGDLRGRLGERDDPLGDGEPIRARVELRRRADEAGR